MHPRFSCFY